MLEIIDKADKIILFELERNSRISETALAKLIHKSKEAVRYRIAKLQRRGILKRFTLFINPATLGFVSGKIYYKLANKPKRKQKLFELVKSDKRLFWLGVADGAWDAGLTFFVKNTIEFYDLKNQLTAQFHDIILEADTGVLVEIFVKDKTIFEQKANDWKTMWRHVPTPIILDSLETKIVDILFKNSRENVVAIARQANTTVDIVRSRMRKLEREQLITKYTVDIDYEKLGFEFYKTFLTLNGLAPQIETKFKEFCMQEPGIIHIVKQISPWDIELEILCQSYAEYNQLIKRLTATFADQIINVQTAVMNEDHVFPAYKS